MTLIGLPGSEYLGWATQSIARERWSWSEDVLRFDVRRKGSNVHRKSDLFGQEPDVVLMLASISFLEVHAIVDRENVIDGTLQLEPPLEHHSGHAHVPFANSCLRFCDVREIVIVDNIRKDERDRQCHIAHFKRR